MFSFGSTFKKLLKRSCFNTLQGIPISIFLRNHPVCCPLHSPLCSYLVVWWVWILSRSSLPCIAPWWFHRTSFLGHDLFPSGCSPSVFVESHGGGGLLKAFIPLSDRCLGKIQCKEGKRECARCSDWTARIPKCCELGAAESRDHHPWFCSWIRSRFWVTCCRVTLLGPGPSAPLIFTCCVSIYFSQEH